MPSEACFDDTPVCDVRPVCLRGAAQQAPTVHGYTCRLKHGVQDHPSAVVLRNIPSIQQCEQMCNVGDESAPCLLYEYEASTQLCLLGLADSAGMRACATDANRHQAASGVQLVIKTVLPSSAVCDSSQLRHFTQPTHLRVVGAAPIVLSTVAAEHAALYGTQASTKVKRLYGTFARSYRSLRAHAADDWLPP